MIPFSNFRQTVWKYYRAYGRHDLPWRNLPVGRHGRNNLYRVLVSEVMLQQTQVERVIPFYKKFIKKFPTARTLATAPLSEVLKNWQGLGYNRRAYMLHQAAKELAATRFNLVTRLNLVARLEALPGVGPYTARAIAAFAYNEDIIFVETNIRTAVIHHFFSRRSDVEDTEILEVLKKVFPKGRSREWHSALMDYGAHLKRSGISHNARSRKYVKQSKFSGSLREVRGAILRELSKGPRAIARLVSLFGDDRILQIYHALENLLAEDLIQKRGRVFSLPR